MTAGPGGLLAVHAHPDDETLSNGALLATWAAAALPVTVVTCTRGEQGEVIGPALAHLEGDGPALAAHREAELGVALTALGVRDHLFLDQVAGSGAGHDARRYVDSGMAWVASGRAGAVADLPEGAFVGVDVEEAAERLAVVLRSRKPEVVVGYEPGGGYGHPDHVHAHRVLQRAVERAAEPGPSDGSRGTTAHEVPVVLWTVVEEPAWRSALAVLREVAPRTAEYALTSPDPSDAPPSCVVDSEQVGVRVDVAPVLDRVLAALRAHASQVQEVEAIVGRADVLLAHYALSNQVLQPVLPTESYRCPPGRPFGPVTWPPGVTATVA